MMQKQSLVTIDWIIVALLVLAAVLMLTSLHNGLLWQDEAETALLARNTLQFGYPRADDGRNLIDASPYSYGPGVSWIYSPWLPIYLLAGIFAFAGESTAVARLPFAFMGWLSIVLAWRLARRLTSDVRVHRLTVALMTCSVPFLLHMRQCRYYGMATLLLIGVCLAYVRFLDRPSAGHAWATAGILVLLFHTNFGTWIPALGAIAAHQMIWRNQVGARRLVIAGLGMFALTLPWAVFAFQPTFVGSLSLDRMFDHLAFYIRTTNKYLMPLAFILGMSLMAIILFGDKPWNMRWSSAVSFLILMGLAQLAFLLIPDQRQIRYWIPVLPLLALGQAWWLTTWWRRSRLIGGLCIPLFLFTNVHQSTSSPGIPLADLAYELTHRYVGPMEGVVDLLRASGRPDELVKIAYDDRTLMFYTDLRIEPHSEFRQESDVDWFILRRGWTPETFFETRYGRWIQTTFQRIELDAPDAYWQNREDPGLHHFRTATWAPRVVVYRKRANAITHEFPTGPPGG